MLLPVIRHLVAALGLGPQLLVLVLAMSSGAARAQDDGGGALLEVKFTPTARAQVAIWIEDDRGRMLRTLALTESVAYRGIGNRPGASQMNSGYRWPYGRREGVLPIWATRRASAPNAKPFRRVVFQNRREGAASQTAPDQSPDDYFCLSFMKDRSTREALDAVSCASVFSSDKGRFITDSDLVGSYAEPFEVSAANGTMMPLDGESLYPPRMDVPGCYSSGCSDHEDLATFADHVRDVMPDIDVITTATPMAEVEQSLLFSLPGDWPKAEYQLWIEVATEGDYNASYGPSVYPTPVNPDGEWDYWAENFGYPYRGQPSVAFVVPLVLRDPAQATAAVQEPIGQSSWNVWDDDFGELEPLSDISDDPTGEPGSGADRLRSVASGPRVTVIAEVFGLSEPAGDDPFEHIFGSATGPAPSGDGDGDGDGDIGGDGDGDGDGSAGGGGTAGSDPAGGASEGGSSGGASDPDAVDPDDADPGDGVILDGDPSDDGVGPIRDLRLRHPGDELHTHQWVEIEFRAPRSTYALHRYEVRTSEAPITGVGSFLRGRAAKEATTSKEGPFGLMLPVREAAGQLVRGTVGDLTASTKYYIAVRAVNRRNQPGPISVAHITTTERTFATVTPCFIATAAYGTTLAPEVSVLRRARDRYLMTNALGRGLVEQYYAWSPPVAYEVRQRPWLAAVVRAVLAPILAFTDWLLA